MTDPCPGRNEEGRKKAQDGFGTFLPRPVRRDNKRCLHWPKLESASKNEGESGNETENIIASGSRSILYSAGVHKRRELAVLIRVEAASVLQKGSA